MVKINCDLCNTEKDVQTILAFDKDKCVLEQVEVCAPCLIGELFPWVRGRRYQRDHQAKFEVLTEDDQPGPTEAA